MNCIQNLAELCIQDQIALVVGIIGSILIGISLEYNFKLVEKLSGK